MRRLLVPHHAAAAAAAAAAGAGAGGQWRVAVAWKECVYVVVDSDATPAPAPAAATATAAAAAAAAMAAAATAGGQGDGVAAAPLLSRLRVLTLSMPEDTAAAAATGAALGNWTVGDDGRDGNLAPPPAVWLAAPAAGSEAANVVVGLHNAAKVCCVWDMRTGKVLDSVTLPRRASAAAMLPLQTGAVDRQTMVVAGKTGDVHVYPLPGISERSVYIGGHATTTIEAMTALRIEDVGEDSETMLVTADKDDKIRISHFPQTSRIQAYCMGHTRRLTSVAELRCSVPPPVAKGSQSAEGDRTTRVLLLSAAADGSLRLWDPLSGKLLAQYVAAQPEVEETEEAEDDNGKAEDENEEKSGPGSEDAREGNREAGERRGRGGPGSGGGGGEDDDLLTEQVRTNAACFYASISPSARHSAFVARRHGTNIVEFFRVIASPDGLDDKDNGTGYEEQEVPDKEGDKEAETGQAAGDREADAREALPMRICSSGVLAVESPVEDVELADDDTLFVLQAEYPFVTSHQVTFPASDDDNQGASVAVAAVPSASGDVVCASLRAKMNEAL